MCIVQVGSDMYSRYWSASEFGQPSEVRHLP